MSIVMVHGSVETSTEKEYINGLEEALYKGYKTLETKKDRLRAIESTINELENNPLYNAGLGSVLNQIGQVEVDGSVMDGESGRFAAVAAMGQIRNAISVAIKIMEETKHVVLAGNGATQFAREMGFPFDNCITQEQLNSWKIARQFLDEGKTLEYSDFTGRVKESDTVGCVLLDGEGSLAAGSSTGGSFMKFPGRVGDTPFIGGGILSTKFCAVVCTGRGEAFIQTLTAKFIDDCIKDGDHPEEAGRKAIKRLYQLTGETGGVLILDNKGNTAAVHNCNTFPVSIIVNGEVQKVIPLKINT